jgi:hypothetical protein
MMRACAVGLFASVAAFAIAQDPAAVKSEGKKGEVVPSPFRAYMVVDNRYPPKVAGSTKPEDRHPQDSTNKMHDLVTEHGLNPVVAVFIGKDAKIAAGGGVAKLATEMNKLMTIPDYRGNKLASFVLFFRIQGKPETVTVTNPDKSESKVELDAEYPVDENRATYETEIRNFANDVKTPNVVFGLAPETSKPATAWSILPQDKVTVVFFNRIRIVDRWTFDENGPTDEQIKTILATVEQSVLGTTKP